MEDLLQKDVKRCLVDYKTAGIQTWMLTGDKGKTAKMIGIQCGMFNSKVKDNPEPSDVNDITEENKKSHDHSIILEEGTNVNPKPKNQGEHDTTTILYEINDRVKDIKAEIDKILGFRTKEPDRKVELLIDGGVFAKMLTAEKQTLVELNKALNSAAAVIIYRASPK